MSQLELRSVKTVIASTSRQVVNVMDRIFDPSRSPHSHPFGKFRSLIFVLIAPFVNLLGLSN